MSDQSSLIFSSCVCFFHTHTCTDVLLMSNKSLIDDYTAVLFSPSSYFTSPVHNYTKRHTWAFSFFPFFFFFPPYFPHLSSCLISWSFPALSHLDKSWNIKQTHTSGLVMLTSVARVCACLCTQVCVCACMCMCSVSSDAAMINCHMYRIYHIVTAHNRHERTQAHSRATNTWSEHVGLKLNRSWTRKQIPTSKNCPLLSLQRPTVIFYVFC